MAMITVGFGVDTSGADVAAGKIIRAEGSTVMMPRHWAYEVGKWRAPDELFDLLDALATTPNAILLRGRPVSDCSEPQVRTGDTLEAVACRWVALDLDKNIPLTEPPARVAQRLPQVFHGVSCWYQYTATHGFGESARLRFIYALDGPVSDETWKAWWPCNGGAEVGVDLSIYSPTQPVFMAAPMLDGIDDPLSGAPRTGRITGVRPFVRADQVSVSNLALGQDSARLLQYWRRPSNLLRFGRYYPVAVKRIIEDICATPPGERHFALRKGATRIVCLTNALAACQRIPSDPLPVLDSLVDAIAEAWGEFNENDDALLTWVVEHVDEFGFPSLRGED